MISACQALLLLNPAALPSQYFSCRALSFFCIWHPAFCPSGRGFSFLPALIWAGVFFRSALVCSAGLRAGMLCRSAAASAGLPSYRKKADFFACLPLSDYIMPVCFQFSQIFFISLLTYVRHRYIMFNVRHRQNARRAGRNEHMMTKDQEREVLRKIIKLVRQSAKRTAQRTGSRSRKEGRRRSHTECTEKSRSSRSRRHRLQSLR